MLYVCVCASHELNKAWQLFRVIKPVAVDELFRVRRCHSADATHRRVVIKWASCGIAQDPMARIWAPMGCAQNLSVK